MPKTDIMILKPVFKERIWGGSALRTVFNLPVPNGKIGEAWVISAHPNGTSVITNGPYAGMSLPEVYQTHRELFGNDPSPVFPLLTKILDAEERLSVQIHPDDVYAKQMENELGKSECWYILDAKPGSTLVLGHQAVTESELLDQIHQDHWDALLRSVPVKKGDFVYLPARTVHAIGAGLLILETQQSSDVTYRLYDYHRIDETTGKPRELHLEKGLANVTIPAPEVPVIQGSDAPGIARLVVSPYFTVEKWTVYGLLTKDNNLHRYYLCTVIEGNAVIGGYAVTAGQSFIVPSTEAIIRIKGTAQLIVSYREN